MKNVIVVEGLSGSGKSTFSKMLASALHLEYVNLDLEAKMCYKDKGVMKRLKNIFPSFIFEGNKVRFGELGKIVFNDLDKLKDLESILYPNLEKRLEKIIEGSVCGCVLDGIKVHETKFFEKASFRIFIERQHDKRINSLINRDNISVEQAKGRDKSIRFDGLKYNFHINNDGSIRDLNKKIPLVISKIIDGNCCMYAGSFDPFTNGHLELIRLASKDYDYVFVGIGNNPNKIRNYDKYEMVSLINNVLESEKIYNAYCFQYDGYTGEFANSLGVKELVRGIRNQEDEAEEKIIEKYNLDNFGIMTKYYLIEGLNHVSSSCVRERIKENLSIKGFVPDLIEKYVLRDSVKKS